MNKKEIQATEKLAQVLDKLADRLEKFQDPVVWQKVLSDSINMIPSLGQAFPTVQPVAIGERTPQIESIAVKLSDTEREKLAKQIYEAVQPQLTEFGDYVQKSLLEMPAHRLKKIAEEMSSGKKPSLGRQHGCVFIEAGSEKVFLGL